MTRCTPSRQVGLTLTLGALLFLAPPSRSVRAQIAFEMESVPHVPIGPACWDPGCLLRADFDGDGFDDLIVRSSFVHTVRPQVLDLLLSSPAGLSRQRPVETGLRSALWMAAGDGDLDGALDLACSSASSNYPDGGSILLGDGRGGFPQPPLAFPVLLNPSDRGLTLSDLDQDGHLDIVTGRTYLLGGPGAEFAPLVAHHSGNLLDVADLDGDGRPELCVWRHIGFQRPIEQQLQVGVLRYTENGRLVEGFQLLAGDAPRFLGDLDASDVNDDGRVDVSDGVALLAWLYLGSAAIPEPFETCGLDLTPDALPCPVGYGLGCE
jgi:hypothetical protein